MGSLRFDSIKLVGFKSFVEPTVFQIDPGLTGVVGPNGCGKSNLLEAIRWVMGANSAKAMRASGMDDVIFSGTKSRPGRNQASVTLHIYNGAKCAPAMFNDEEQLEVTRIITKGAGSKYKVNGKTVRAKDVQLLFADASTGANSPALVRQGQINELISAKPANRRRILEEAAGISGLHTRRHEAELRLRAAENNLERLEDILAQIESQLLSLRRQSRQAARYKRLAGEIREYKALLWLKRWQAALATLTQTQDAQAEWETNVQELTGLVANLTTKVSEIAVQLEPHREEQIVSAAICGRLNAAKDALDNDERAAKSEIEKLKSRLSFLTGDIEREEAIVTDARLAVEKLKAELEALSGGEDNHAALDAAKADAENAKSVRSALESEYHRLSSQLAQHSATIAGFTREQQDLKRRQDRTEKDIARVTAQIADLQQQDKNETSGNLFAASAQNADKALRDARSREQQANEDKHRLEDETQTLRDALTDAQSALSEALAQKNALSAIVNSGVGDGNWTPIVDEITVTTGYETALAVALGDDLEAGRSPELPQYWRTSNAPAQSLPEGVSALSDYVNGPDELAARLSQIGIVDDERGASTSKLLKPGQRLVSKSGELWRWDGYCKNADAPSAAATKLQNINALEVIESKIPALKDAQDKAQETWQARYEALKSVSILTRTIRDDIRKLENEVREAQTSLSRFETEQARKAEQITALQDRLTRLQTEQAEIAQALEKTNLALDEMENVEGLKSEIENISKDLEQARERTDEALAKYRGLENESAARTARKKAVQNDLKDWERRGAQARDRIGGLKGRLAETETALEAALRSPDEFDQRKQQILSELSEAENRAQKASDALVKVEAELKEAENNLRTAEGRLGQARETRAGNEARHQAAIERKDDIIARVQEALECTPEALPDLLDTLSPDSGLSEHDVERKLERLSKEREKLGGVNLRADEEAAEQEERLSALNDERQDLLAAIARLRQGIDSLNEEGREKLRLAFDVVNGHFGRLFTTLFGGGQASLALTESDDPLEAGLEILVSPPGKRLGSMSLMSGGEQALSATALIFAVFLSNPAPICVLDEVDAPLDDANVERYCDLLDEMRKQTETKFIAITHNPVTMARMDRLFGVTMAEKGVSQLVSMALGEAKKLTA